jgi:hypothetical protein
LGPHENQTPLLLERCFLKNKMTGLSVLTKETLSSIPSTSKIKDSKNKMTSNTQGENIFEAYI